MIDSLSYYLCNIETWIRSLLFNCLAFILLFIVLCLIILVSYSPKMVRQILTSSLFLLKILMKFVLNIDWEIELASRQYPVIYAPRHESSWETVALPIVLQDKVVVFAKSSLFQVPILSTVLNILNVHPVDEYNAERALNSISKVSREWFSKGYSILIFPEGERMAPGTFRRMKHGIGSIYQDNNVPIVPIALNAGELWGKRSFMKYPGKIYVKELQEIKPGLAKPEVLELLGDILKKGTEELYKKAGNKRVMKKIEITPITQ